MEEETKKEEEVVEIKKTDLQSLLERLDKVEKDNNMLLSVADKGRVSRYELINQEELIRTAKISFLKKEKVKLLLHGELCKMKYI